MKKLFIINFIILFMFTYSYLYAESDKKIEGLCPKTKMTIDCLKCHTIPNFKLKESFSDETLQYPIKEMRIINNIGYLLLREIDDNQIKKFFDYLDIKNIKNAVMEIHCPGGGLFAASRVINLMAYWEIRGGTIETRVYGFALSGGFMVFIAGSKGNRFVSPYADLMWHEVISFEMFAIKIMTPSDKEEEARILRHLQDMRNNWIATRGKISKEELDAKTKKREWWISGKEAVEFGFADGFIK